MSFEIQEILETIRMTEVEHFDIRTTTMGISLRDCGRGNAPATIQAIYDKICRYAERHVATAREVEQKYGIAIANKRISITPASIACDGFTRSEFVQLAKKLDEAAERVGVDFLAGFSALVQKGFTKGDRALIESIPEAIGSTKRVCSSINVGSTKAGINMDAIIAVSKVIKDLAQVTASEGAIGCAKFVVFCNAVEDNPFVAGAFHGVTEAECTINVGISGPGVVLHAIKQAPDADLGELSEIIKRMTFKITRAGELIGREVARQQNIDFGIVDLSLAPTPAPGDSIADILVAMGLEDVGACGTTAALAMLNDAVKKGGLMASSYVGGLSGAFIPVSEDQGMIAAVEKGNLSLEKLEAMTCVCSVGLDMVAVPGDTTWETIAGLIADESAIGMINSKTTAVRIIPVPGKKVGESVDYGGLLGKAPIMPIRNLSPKKFIGRGGRIPAPTVALSN
ncbi:PFL family protein [bacterium]|nr:PFL family protein [bacterium]NUN45308.1 PFL family protein [bacterium]